MTDSVCGENAEASVVFALEELGSPAAHARIVVVGGSVARNKVADGQLGTVTGLMTRW